MTNPVNIVKFLIKQPVILVVPKASRVLFCTEVLAGFGRSFAVFYLLRVFALVHC